MEHGKRYTPDFLLTFANGERLVFEVKRSERIKKQKARFDEIAALCRQSSLYFFVVHQGQIEGQRRAERAALIRRYAMHRLDRELTQAVKDFLHQRHAGIAIKQLMKKLPVSQEQLLGMAAQRHIALNKELLICDDGLLFPVNSEITNASVQFGNWFGCAPWSATVGVSQPAGGKQGAVSGSEDTTGPSHEAFSVLRGGNE